jgi:hypothetical protein
MVSRGSVEQCEFGLAFAAQHREVDLHPPDPRWSASAIACGLIDCARTNWLFGERRSAATDCM